MSMRWMFAAPAIAMHVGRGLDYSAQRQQC